MMWWHLADMVATPFLVKILTLPKCSGLLEWRPEGELLVTGNFRNCTLTTLINVTQIYMNRQLCKDSFDAIFGNFEHHVYLLSFSKV